MNNMINEIVIAKNIFLSHMKDETSIDWEAITLGFAVFENDLKPLYAEIYKLELADPEEIISKLPELHELFIEELAEAYVLDKSSVVNNELKESPLFKEKVSFFRTLKNVIAKQERKRIIQELPKMSNHLDFSFSENEIESALKKKARADLKEKFDKWDKEIISEENEVVYAKLHSLDDQIDESLTTDVGLKEKGKVISLSWIKYAVAALVVVSAGFFYFNTDKFDGPEPVIADIKHNTQNVIVITETGLGYMDTTINDSISITYVAYKERKDSSEYYKRRGGYGPEANLKNIELTYTFFNSKLTIYGVTAIPEVITDTIIKTVQNKYYIKIEELYFSITESEDKKELKIETDSLIIEELEKIMFNYE